MKKSIKVLVIDDSLVFRESLRRVLDQDPALEVVGVAADVFQANDLIESLQPDVLTLDIEMPRMDGIDFLRRLMAQCPLPVIVVSSVSQRAFDAIREGAVDFISKPAAGTGGLASLARELILKVKIASTAKVGPATRPALPRPSPSVDPQGDPVAAKLRLRLQELMQEKMKAERPVELIVIGASTGGTEAISKILSQLAGDLPPILIVQHMMPLFTKLFAERLNKSCHLEVCEAVDGQVLRRGGVVLAAGEHHLSIVRKGRDLVVSSQKGERVNGHCPAVDVLFESASRLQDLSILAVLLTGMGYDGAKGLLALKKQGAITIGQDEDSCIVYGMPKVAYDLGGVDLQAPLDQIAPLLLACSKSSTTGRK
jgi:two-component system chemotaxis response regulator CheB